MQKIRYLSLFSGIGGFELGIGQRGQCVGFSEVDRFAQQIYQAHFSHPPLGDITKIDTRKLPDFELLVGGFPCQAFSLAGRRLGFSDPRGNLFFEIIRILHAKRPRLVMLENVKGLLSHQKGETFKTILVALDELGYDCQWNVLNSKNHGTPQNRERVFIIGHFRGTPRPEVFPLSESYAINTQAAPQGNDLAYCLQAGSDKHRGSYIRLDKSGKAKRDQNIAATLTAGANSGGNHSDMDILLTDTSLRRLTPIECERLQGFPDNWTKFGRALSADQNRREQDQFVKISDTQRYKSLGNAVTVHVIDFVAKRLLG